MSNKEPIKKKLIYFKSKENFENALKEGRIKESSIVFIGNLENNRETLIYTHGRYFGHTSSEIKDLVRLVVSDSKEISIGEDYGNGIEISYPEEIEWERINSNNSFNSEIDSVQSAILKLDKNISTLANEVIKDEKIIAEALTDLHAKTIESYVFDWGVEVDFIREEDYNNIKNAKQVIVNFGGTDETNYSVVNNKIITNEGIYLFIYSSNHIDQFLFEAPDEDGDSLVTYEKTTVGFDNSTSESLCYLGIVNLTKDPDHSINNKNIDYVSRNLANGQVGLCFISDSNGNYPSEEQVISINSNLTVDFGYFFSSEAKAVNVGDILLINKLNISTNSTEVSILKLEVVPLSEARASQNDIPGTNGIMTSQDKEKILKIDDIESLVNRVSVEKQEKLVPGINIKTINGESILGEGNLEISGVSEFAVKITYSDLKTLRDSSQLVPGMQYRITDYRCTTTQAFTESADHQFDIIVTANDESTLSHLAKATLHEEDTYFENSNLRAWQLWYNIDNDETKYLWADEENGKGVIYRMIDEHNNDCPYDFKNMKFLVNDRENDTIPNYCYTFSYIFEDVLYDGSTKYTENCYENKIGEYSSNGKLYLNNIFFINIIGVNSFSNCYGNIFKNNCRSNNFRNNCYLNTFGDSCGSNVFGNDCYNNTFGYDCRSNTFGDKCYNNTFGHRCYENTFGDSNNSNTFGNNCYFNTFGDYSDSNTLRNDCHDNTFGNHCQSNSFNLNCEGNTFGNDCSLNRFGIGCDYIKFGTYYKNIELGNHCQKINLKSSKPTSSWNYDHLQNIRITNNFNSTLNSPEIDVIADIDSHRNLIITQDSDENIIQYYEEDIFDKQNTLIPGITIKTINGESILGEGNIVIESNGFSGANVEAVNPEESLDDVLDPNPETKESAVIETTEDTILMIPNKYYKKINTSSQITIMFETPVDDSIVNSYNVEFSTADTGTSISLPNTVKWLNGELPVFEDGYTYQISVINGLGVYAKFA